MALVAAALLLHRGHGPRHADLILGTGARCRTIHIALIAGRWQVREGMPHRRRYLAYRGPVPGRGAVDQLWRGRAWCVVSATVLRCRLRSKQVFWMKLREALGEGEGAPTALRGTAGEMVVPLGRPATLPRS